MALAANPRVLVLDEPTIALDPLMQEQLLAYLQELATQGHTVFFPVIRWPRWSDSVIGWPFCARVVCWLTNPWRPCAVGGNERSG